jgi:hypothetical protein
MDMAYKRRCTRAEGRQTMYRKAFLITAFILATLAVAFQPDEAYQRADEATAEAALRRNVGKHMARRARQECESLDPELDVNSALC